MCVHIPTFIINNRSYSVWQTRVWRGKSCVVGGYIYSSESTQSVNNIQEGRKARGGCVRGLVIPLDSVRL